MNKYLCNGISESMKRDPNMKMIPYSLSESEFIDLVKHASFKSCIGHRDLAECLSQITGTKIRYNRTNVTVNYDDLILLVSLKGRLPERPTHVEYEDRLNYSLIRFEKQSADELETSRTIFEELIVEVEV